MSEVFHPFAVDYDGVMVEKLPITHLLRNTTKMGLATIPGASEGVQFLNEQPDMRSLGVMTARPKWLRERQTRRQIERRGFPFDEITYTGKYQAKVEHVLLAAVGLNPHPNLEHFSHRISDLLDENQIGRIVLIDDNKDKIIQGARDLNVQKPFLRPLLQRLTFFAFGSHNNEPEGTIIPDVIHVVGLPDWSGVQNAVELTRNHYERN